MATEKVQGWYPSIGPTSKGLLGHHKPLPEEPHRHMQSPSLMIAHDDVLDGCLILPGAK